MSKLNLDQILFYILVVELTDLSKLNKLRLNRLSIAIFGDIQFEITKKSLIEHLSRLLHSKVTELKPTIIIDIDKQLSDQISHELIGKRLNYKLTIKQTEIIIEEIFEVGQKKNYLNEPLLLPE